MMSSQFDMDNDNKSLSTINQSMLSLVNGRPSSMAAPHHAARNRFNSENFAVIGHQNNQQKNLNQKQQQQLDCDSSMASGSSLFRKNNQL